MYESWPECCNIDLPLCGVMMESACVCMCVCACESAGGLAVHLCTHNPQPSWSPTHTFSWEGQVSDPLWAVWDKCVCVFVCVCVYVSLCVCCHRNIWQHQLLLFFFFCLVFFFQILAWPANVKLQHCLIGTWCNLWCVIIKHCIFRFLKLYKKTIKNGWNATVGLGIMFWVHLAMVLVVIILAI